MDELLDELEMLRARWIVAGVAFRMLLGRGNFAIGAISAVRGGSLPNAPSNLQNGRGWLRCAPTLPR